MSEHTTQIPEIRRLQRSRSDRMLAGVSGGLARYFEIHPAVFRVGFVVLTLLGGAGILIYAAAALVIPDEGKEDSIATAALRNRRERPWPLIGLGLLAVAVAILLSRATLWPDGDVVVAVPARGRPDPLAHAASGGGPDGGCEGARGRRTRAACDASCARSPSSWRPSLALALVAVATFMAVFDVHLGSGIGDRTYVVTSVAGAARRLPARDRLARSSISASCSFPRARRTSRRASTSATWR